MAGYVYNPERRAWRGRSYKKGGLRFAELRSSSMLRAQMESLIFEEAEKEKEENMERFIITNPDRTSFISSYDFMQVTSMLKDAAMFRAFNSARCALNVFETGNPGGTNFEICRIEFVTCDPLCFEEQ